MGQVEKIFVVSIVGLVLLILAITVFGPSHQDAQACVVPPATESAGLENPLQPPAQPAAEEAAQPRENGEAPLVVERVDEATPAEAAAPGGSSGEPVPAAAPKEELLPSPAPAPVRPEPKAQEKPEPRPASAGYRPKPVVPYVIVKKGETLGEILLRELGSAHKYLDVVLQFNEGMDPNHLVEGQKIWLPPNLPRVHRNVSVSAPARRAQPRREAPAPSRTYKVRKGDSLWKIAVKFFGKEKVLEGIRRIKRANAGKDLDTLPAGLVLVIPR